MLTLLFALHAGALAFDVTSTSSLWEQQPLSKSAARGAGMVVALRSDGHLYGIWCMVYVWRVDARTGFRSVCAGLVAVRGAGMTEFRGKGALSVLSASLACKYGENQSMGSWSSPPLWGLWGKR